MQKTEEQTLFRSLNKFLILFGLSLGIFLVACAEKPPVEEYTLARSAVNAAQDYGANKYAPGLWYKAQQSYRDGETLFKKGKFSDARDNFLDSQTYAERAENKARYEKRRLGEDLP